MRSTSIAIIVLSGVALSLSALAQGQGNKEHGHGGPPPGRGPAAGPGGPHGESSSLVVIPDHDRTVIHDYYHGEYVAGRCPPGLAKKGNGCLPPGQAKKMWEIGRPLPMGVVYEPVVLGGLSPPAGYQYVRVANDILMMAVGTRMIAGAVADLSSF